MIYKVLKMRALSDRVALDIVIRDNAMFLFYQNVREHQ